MHVFWYIKQSINILDTLKNDLTDKSFELIKFEKSFNAKDVVGQELFKDL